MLTPRYELTGNRMRVELIMYGRFLAYKGYRDQEIVPLLQSKSKGTILEYNLNKQEVIKDLMNKIHLREIYHDKIVEITEDELYKIKLINHHSTERVMFVLLVIQKFFNSNYVKTNATELQKLCKLNYNINYFKENILKRLCDIGYIKTYATNLYKVNIRMDESPTIIEVKDYENIIQYYLNTCGSKEYIYCLNCGKKTKRNSNRQKYCQECSSKINIQKTAKRHKKFDLENMKTP